MALFTLMLLFNFVVFPCFGTFYRDAPQRILDLRLYYSNQDVMAFFNALGTSGRYLYLWQLAVADMVYPLVYTGLLYLVMQLVYTKPRQWVFLLPFATALADVIENTFIIIMLYNFPVIYKLLPLAASVFTFAKWLLVVVVVIVLILGLIRRFCIRKQ